MKRNRLHSGFTLLEILVVMVIIGILATIGLRSFGSSQVKARDAKRKSDMHNIATALEVYHNDKGQYPVGNNGVMMGCGIGAAEACTWGEIWQEDFATASDTIYMVKLPADPAGGASYYYVSAVPNKTYRLYATLENGLDGDINAADSGLQCGAVECNYVVTSTNESI